MPESPVPAITLTELVDSGNGDSGRLVDGAGCSAEVPSQSPIDSKRSGRATARRARCRRRRSERGTTLVEYALIVALFAIPTAGAINFLRDVSKAKIQQTANGISERQAPGGG